MSCVQNPIQTILGTECIGDSLPKINTNFSVLGDNVCQLLTAVDSFNVVDSPTVDLTFDSYTRTLSADVKDASVTNAKIAFDGGAFAFRNKIINGNFDIWQRGTSLASGTDVRFLADRFLNQSFGSTYTVSRQSFALGQTSVPNEPTYFHRAVVSSVAGTGNRCVIAQRIESVKTLAGKTATLSFYAKADSNKSIAVEFAQEFGTGGSPSSFVAGIGVQKLNLTTSWQKFTVTANIPSIAGKTIGTDNNDYLQITFWLDAGSDWNSRTDSLGQQSGTFDIAQVQLEEGSVATPFEQRPIGTELALCQRYYYKAIGTSYGNFFMPAYTYYLWSPGGSGVGGRGYYQFPVTMRSSPQLTTSAMSTFLHQDGVSTGYTLDSLQINSPTVFGCLLLWRHTSGSATSGQGGSLFASNTVNSTNNAFLAFDAEL